MNVRQRIWGVVPAVAAARRVRRTRPTSGKPRVERLHDVLRAAIAATRRDGFRIVHYSIQNDHLHMLVEADDARALTNGMKSFAVRVAMRVNHWVMRRRTGRVCVSPARAHDAERGTERSRLRPQQSPEARGMGGGARRPLLVRPLVRRMDAPPRAKTSRAPSNRGRLDLASL